MGKRVKARNKPAMEPRKDPARPAVMSNSTKVTRTLRSESSESCPTRQTGEAPVSNDSSLQGKCPKCLLTAHQLGIPDHRIQKGDFRPHVILCRGIGDDGNPLGMQEICLVTDCTRRKTQTATPAAWTQHYWRSHQIKLNDFPDVKSLREFLQPWHAPDFEMNGDWGFFLTKKPPIQEFEHLTKLWHATSDPVKFRAKFQHQLVHDYRHAFESTFHATPISWHSHASDAWPALPSVVALLEDDGPVRSKKLTMSQMENSRVATFESQLLSYHGPLANGGRGIKWAQKCIQLGKAETINMSAAGSKQKLLDKFKALVNSGYVAVALEMVRQCDGRVVRAQEWNTICECCEEAGLYLVVDEVLTAWRCGAPFAHQLPEYSKHKPSFVVFGKAVGASGLAVHWDGVHLKRLGYADPGYEVKATDFVHHWDHKSSRIIDPNEALRSWGYILLSEKDEWSKRALQIGKTLRENLKRLYPEIRVAGRGALIYLPDRYARKMDIVGAAVDGKFIRWLPYLDEGLNDSNIVSELFNESGTTTRRILTRSISNFNALRCIACGDYLHVPGYGPCPRCAGFICQICVESGDDMRHREGRCLFGASE